MYKFYNPTKEVYLVWRVPQFGNLGAEHIIPTVVAQVNCFAEAENLKHQLNARHGTLIADQPYIFEVCSERLTWLYLAAIEAKLDKQKEGKNG